MSTVEDLVDADPVGELALKGLGVVLISA